MWETDSEQVPWGKDEKNFEKRVKKYLKLLRTKGWRLVMTRAIPGSQSIRLLWLPSFTWAGCRRRFGIRSFGSRSEWIRGGWNWRREGNLGVRSLELIARRLETVVDWGAEARALSFVSAFAVGFVAVGEQSSVSVGGSHSNVVHMSRSGFWRNGRHSPVLKHGPRSLTYMRVIEWKTRLRNEGDWMWSRLPGATSGG